MLIKVKTHQEDKIIINLYAPNVGEVTNINTFIHNGTDRSRYNNNGCLHTLVSSIHRSATQKILRNSS
jgi:hypothetical protein